MFRRALTRGVAFCLPALLMIGCGGNSKRADLPAEPAAPNTLTDAERRAGWRLLFDGTSTFGWHTYRKQGVEGWTAKDGMLYRTAAVGDLVSDQQYDSFEMTIEWKLGEKGNSGIFWWANEGTDVIYENAPEMQVLDNIGHTDGRTPLTSAGALYGLSPAPATAVKPLGEWNTAHILTHGGRVELWLNGIKTADANFDSQELKDKIAASKFKQWPTFGKSRRGHIGLQEHESPVWYRNIKIREIVR